MPCRLNFRRIDPPVVRMVTLIRKQL
jgi:hypothetical protein